MKKLVFMWYIFISIIYISSISGCSLDDLDKDTDDIKNEISHKIQLKFPERSKIIFFKDTYGINSELIYLELRMSPDEFKSFVKNSTFKDESLKISGNIFEGTKSPFQEWNPASKNASTSGVLNMDDRATIRYLFDFSTPSKVDTYFEIGIE